MSKVRKLLNLKKCTVILSNAISSNPLFNSFDLCPTIMEGAKIADATKKPNIIPTPFTSFTKNVSRKHPKHRKLQIFVKNRNFS